METATAIIAKGGPHAVALLCAAAVLVLWRTLQAERAAYAVELTRLHEARVAEVARVVAALEGHADLAEAVARLVDRGTGGRR